MPTTTDQAAPADTAPAKWSFGLDGGWRILGNVSAMGAVIMMMFLLRADTKESAEANRLAAEQAHKDAQTRSDKFMGAINELTGETRAARIELQSIRASNERTERVLSGAETPWWAPPRAGLPVTPKADRQQ